jgi:hypothetical protein
LGDTDAVMNFYKEDDRNTESSTAEKMRQTIATKMKKYDQHFEDGGPMARYGRRTVSVLWLTTTEARAKLIVKQAAKTKYPHLHAVKVFPDYKEFPPLSDIMVSQTWERAEGGPLDIMKTLRKRLKGRGMYDRAKVERINALVKTIEDAEAKLNAELGGEPVKKTWSRRPKTDAPKTEGSPA